MTLNALFILKPSLSPYSYLNVIPRAQKTRTRCLLTYFDFLGSLRRIKNVLHTRQWGK